MKMLLLFVQEFLCSIESNKYPIDLIKKAWSLGLVNGHIPQEFGKLSHTSKVSNIDTSILININFKVAWGYLLSMGA